MGAGIAFSGLSWIAAGAMQLTIDDGEQLSITWQVLPYALLTFGEVLTLRDGFGVRL
jgi:POT family proton-dependent oligopeptide transporter